MNRLISKTAAETASKIARLLVSSAAFAKVLVMALKMARCSVSSSTSTKVVEMATKSNLDIDGLGVKLGSEEGSEDDFEDGGGAALITIKIRLKS